MKKARKINRYGKSRICICRSGLFIVFYFKQVSASFAIIPTRQNITDSVQEITFVLFVAPLII